jgi:hypothetical protein
MDTHYIILYYIIKKIKREEEYIVHLDTVCGWE